MNFRRGLYIFIFLVSILFAFILKSPIGLMPMIFMFLSTLFSYIYLILIKKSCEVLVNDKEDNIYERLSYESYRITVRNKGPLIFPKAEMDFTLLDDEENIVRNFSYEFMMVGREKKVFTPKIVFPHIGSYQIKINRLQLFGIFDLMSVLVETNWKDKVFISPKKYNINNMRIKTMNPNKPIEYNVPEKIDGEIYDDIREYIPGDSIRNIHWKLSAHSGELMTKILTTDAVSAVNIYADFKQVKDMDREKVLDINDCLIESVYAIGLYAFDNYRFVNLIYSDSSGYLNKSPIDKEKFYLDVLSLPSYNTDKYYSIDTLISNNTIDIRKLDNMYVLTNNMTDELLSIISEINERGLEPTLCYISFDKSDKWIEKLKSKGINFYTFSSALEFKEILGGAKLGKKK